MYKWHTIYIILLTRQELVILESGNYTINHLKEKYLAT